MIEQHLEVAIITMKQFLDALLFTAFDLLRQVGELLKYQKLTKVYLLLFDIVVNLGALVHDVAAHHELGVGEDLGDRALVPVVLVEVDAEAAKLDVDREPTVWVWCLVGLQVVAGVHQLNHLLEAL